MKARPLLCAGILAACAGVPAPPPLPLVVVRTHREREAFAPGSRWRPPPDFFPHQGVLYAYPDTSLRPLMLRDPLGRRARVLALDERGRSVWERTLRLGPDYVCLDPGRPVRFYLFLPPAAAGRTWVLPPAAWVGAEPEWRPVTDPPPVQIRVGGVPLVVEVGCRAATRQLGLMYRTRLESGRGFLFLYPTPRALAFWGVNTRLRLEVLFADAGGVIRSIRPVPRLSAASVRSPGPAVLALEVLRGWAARHGVRPGARVALPPALEALRRRAED